MLPALPFESTYAALPERFFARLSPTPVREPRLLHLNVELARSLGLDPDSLSSKDGVALLAGNAVPPRMAALRSGSGTPWGGAPPMSGL